MLLANNLCLPTLLCPGRALNALPIAGAAHYLLMLLWNLFAQGFALWRRSTGRLCSSAERSVRIGIGPSSAQKMAIGLVADAVPLISRNGAITSMNSQR